jgi:hypothetical protein
VFCLGSALAAADSRVLRYWVVVSVCILIIARGASVLVLSPDAVRISSTVVVLKLPIFKYGESGFSPQVSLLTPATGDDNPIRRPFIWLLACTPESAAAAPLFNQPNLIAVTAPGLRGVAARPPPGARRRTARAGNALKQSRFRCGRDTTLSRPSRARPRLHFGRERGGEVFGSQRFHSS